MNLFLLFTLLVSCSPSLTRIGYDDISEKSIENCNIPVVKDSSLVFSNDIIIGSIEIGDPGLAINCGPEEINKILQDEACKVEADLVHIKELNPPDLWSTCYRLTADFIKFKSIENNSKVIVSKYSFEIGEQEKYFEGVHIDSLEVPITDFRASVGVEVTKPTIAINSYMYIYGIGLNYSYGLSSTTGDPTKWIKDIENVHHIRLNLDVGSLQNNISFSPIYLGIGKSFINEKSNVQGYTGDGIIAGTHYFIGLRFLGHRNSFLNTVSTYFEFGKSNWDYEDSILNKNKSGLKYNDSSFYFSLGICVYIY